MNDQRAVRSRRILVIDDNPAIHEDFRRILSFDPAGEALEAAEHRLFGQPPLPVRRIRYQIDSAYQGEEGVALARQALESGSPYCLAFVDVRMPPGWDGVETTREIWKVDPAIQIVICTAYSDYSWDEMFGEIGDCDNLVILKKPFDAVEALQLAHALCEKWWLHRQSRLKMEELEESVAGRTRELREANEALRRQTTELRVLFDYLPAMICFKDTHNGIVRVNKRLADAAGKSVADIEGKSVQEIFPADSAKFFANDLEVIRSGLPLLGIIETRRDPAGGDIAIQTDLVPVQDGEGDVIGIVVMAQDITERKKLEEQMFRSQRMECIGTLAGGIAHDLNNVLTPIMMSVELLEHQESDPGRLNILSIIQGSTRRGADMVAQVLSFARGVKGEQMEVKVGPLLHEIEKITCDTFPKNIEVRLDAPADLWSVLGDATQLHQVLLNLCVNSRDAMPSGGILTLSAGNLQVDAHYAALNGETKAGPYVFIRVEDNGVGIPPEIMTDIFDPFFTTKDVGKGTGLGLSTSLAILKSHGGFIRAYSELGNGTRFQINLPALIGHPPEPSAELPAAPPRGNGELILVVDDESPVRQITRLTLEAFGYRAVLASDGAEAIDIYARRHGEIAVVLTDLMMPVMDGPATIRGLREIAPNVRIIAASGLSSGGKIANLGVKHFLPKPYTSESLMKMLDEVLHPGN